MTELTEEEGRMLLKEAMKNHAHMLLQIKGSIEKIFDRSIAIMSRVRDGTRSRLSSIN